MGTPLSPSSSAVDGRPPREAPRVVQRCRPRSISHGPADTAAEREVLHPPHEPRATSHEPRATSHEPRATSHEPRATGDRLFTVIHGASAAGGRRSVRGCPPVRWMPAARGVTQSAGGRATAREPVNRGLTRSRRAETVPRKPRVARMTTSDPADLGRRGRARSAATVVPRPSRISPFPVPGSRPRARQGLSRDPWRAHDDSCGTSPRCRNPEYDRYEDAPSPCDAPHLTPRADPPGITGQPLGAGNQRLTPESPDHE